MDGLNLDPFLFPKNSPYAQNQGATSGYDFDWGNEAGVISTSKIRSASIGNAQLGTAIIGTAQVGTLTFNEISGGTATLGGTLNGNGLVQVLNPAGGTVVQLNSSGLTVTNGSITIQNSGGTNIVDSAGLVSASVFEQDSYYSGSQVLGTNTFAYTDVTGSDLSVVLTRSAVVLVTFFANVKLYATDPFRGYHIDVAIGINGTAQNQAGRFEVSNMNSDLGSALGVATTYLLPSGTTTLNLRWAAFADTVSELNTRGLNYCILGS